MNTQEIEKKWQNYWVDNKSFEAVNGSDKKPYYILVEFPYPSGSGLHVGHVRSYTALDAMARIKRMQGYNVLSLAPSVPPRIGEVTVSIPKRFIASVAVITLLGSFLMYSAIFL